MTHANVLAMKFVFYYELASSPVASSVGSNLRSIYIAFSPNKKKHIFLPSEVSYLSPYCSGQSGLIKNQELLYNQD